MSEITNYNYCLEVIELKQNIEVAFLALGERLMSIRDKNLYVGSWDSFADYLNEIKMSESVASRIITVYKTLVQEYGISAKLIANAGGWSNAYEISKLAKNKDEAVSLLEDASLKTPKDVKIAIREAKTGIKQDECKHEDTYILTVCRHCGIKILENEDNKTNNGMGSGETE